MAGPGGKEVGRLSLKVLPDTSSFGRSLGAYVKRLERQVVVRLNVELDNGDMAREMAGLAAQVKATTPTIEPEVKPDVDGTATRRGMAALLAQLKVMARVGRPTIRPDVDGTRAQIGLMAMLATRVGDTAGSASNVGRQIALWGPLIFAAASLIVGIVPALAALLPLVAGIGIGIGAIALGWNQVKEVLAPIKDAFAGVREEIGLVLTAGLQPLIAEFASSFVPVLVDGLTAVSGLINAAARNFLEFFNSSEGLQLTAEFLLAMTNALEPLTALAGPLAEVFLRLATAAAPALEMMSNAIVGVTEDFAEWLTGADSARVITDSMEILGHALVTVGHFIRDLFPPLFAAAPAVIAAFDAIGTVLGYVLNAMTPVFQFMSEHQGTVKLLAGAFAGLALAAGVVIAVLAVVGLIMSSTAALIAAAIGAVVGAVIIAYNEFDWFRNAVQIAMTVIGAIIRTVIALVIGYLKLPVIAVQLVIAAFNRAKSAISSAMSAVASFVSGRVAAVKSTLSSIAGVVTSVIGFFGRLRSGAAERLESLVSFVRTLPSKIKGAFSGAGTMLADTGRNIIRGLIGGIRDMAGSLVSAIKSYVIDKIPGPVKKALGIASPSRVFRDEIGKWIPLGIVAGITRGLPALNRALESMVALPAVAGIPLGFDFDDFDPPGPGDGPQGGGGGDTYNVYASDGMDEHNLAQLVGNQVRWRKRR